MFVLVWCLCSSLCLFVLVGVCVWCSCSCVGVCVLVFLCLCSSFVFCVLFV